MSEKNVVSWKMVCRANRRSNNKLEAYRIHENEYEKYLIECLTDGVNSAYTLNVLRNNYWERNQRNAKEEYRTFRIQSFKCYLRLKELKEQKDKAYQRYLEAKRISLKLQKIYSSVHIHKD